MDPLFYREHHAKKYYNGHVESEHPEFARWDRRIQRYYAILFLPVGICFLLLFGLPNYIPSTDLPYVWFLFSSAITLSIVVLGIAQKKKVRLRDDWFKHHPRTG